MGQTIMKRIFLLIFWVNLAAASHQVVNVYNWTGYMPSKVLKEFKSKTGIEVNFSTFASNDELFAKLAAKGGDSGYDIIVPSADFVSRMSKLGMLKTIDYKKIHGKENLNPSLLNKPFDPHNAHSLPYLWGITGVMINRQYYPTLKIRRWHDLWNKNLNNQVLMLDEMKEPFEIALRVLGHPANSQNPSEIKAAYKKLIELMPNIKLFNITAPQSIFANGDIGIGVVYNGDAFVAMQDNPNLDFIFPEDGAFIWIDNIAIPKNAPHLNNAYAFINFILQPKIAKEIAEFSGYSSPNLKAIQRLPKNIQDNRVLYPSKQVISKATFERDLGDANTLYEHYWFLLKLGAH